MLLRHGIRPRLRLVLDLPAGPHEFRQVFPVRRRWSAILVLAAFDVVFTIPAVLTFRQAAAEWAAFDSLFDLVAALFLSAWLVGWSVAPLGFTAILLLLLFGREVVTVGPGGVRSFIGLPWIGVAATYDAARMRNLRVERIEGRSARAWRGRHVAFDYGANDGAIGSDLGPDEAERLKTRIESVCGTAIRHGPAAPEEPAADLDPPRTGEVANDAGQSAARGTAPVTLASPSALALVIANLVPVAGTLMLGWRLSDIMVLYWAESAVVGLFTLFKIVVVGRWSALFFGPFFLGHFGAFMAVHFLFIYMLFVKGPAVNSGGDLAEVARLFAGLWPALAALFVSHAYSFVTNFLGRREYRRRTVQKQMGEPYGRIVFMHLVLIFGGFVTLLLGQPEPVLIAVIVLKIVFDLRAHLRQHDGRSASTARLAAKA